MRTLGFQMINEGLMLTRAGYRILLGVLYVNSRAELEALLLDNGVAEADIESTIDLIWTAMTDPDTGVAYANYAAFDNQIYNQGGILKEDIVAAIPTATSPGTANLVAAYDFNNTVPGEGKADSYTGGYDLTEVNSPSYVTTSPEYAECPSTAHFTSTGLSSNWANADGDWTGVFRFRWNTTIPNNQPLYYSGGGRDYLRTKAGNIYTVRLGAGTELNLTASSSYDGQWTTVIIEHDTSEDETRIYFLNENKTATQSGVTGDWNSSVAQIGSTSGSYEIDFAYFFNDLLTESERQWFGNNSSIHRNFSDL